MRRHRAARSRVGLIIDLVELAFVVHVMLDQLATPHHVARTVGNPT